MNMEIEPNRHSLSTFDACFLCFYPSFIISFMFISETQYPSESSDGFAATIVYFVAIAIVSLPISLLTGFLISLLKKKSSCAHMLEVIFFLVIASFWGSMICGVTGFVTSAQSAFSNQIITIAAISGGVSGAITYLLK